MGPFELVDLVGLDTRLSILEYLHKSLGDKYRPAPLLVQYVKAGRLGRKVRPRRLRLSRPPPTQKLNSLRKDRGESGLNKRGISSGKNRAQLARSVL